MRKHEILIRKLFSDYNLLHLQAHSSLEAVLWGFPKELYRWSVVTVTSYVGIHHTRVFSGKKLIELKKCRIDGVDHEDIARSYSLVLSSSTLMYPVTLKKKLFGFQLLGKK